MSDSVEARTKLLRAALLPAVANMITKSGYAGDYDLVLDEKGMALQLAGEPIEIAKAAEIADGSFANTLGERVKKAISSVVPWRASDKDDDEPSAPCDCEIRLTDRAKRIMAEIEARWSR